MSEGKEFPACGGIPEFQGIIMGTGSDGLSIRAKGYGMYRVCMPHLRKHLNVRLHLKTTPGGTLLPDNTASRDSQRRNKQPHTHLFHPTTPLFTALPATLLFMVNPALSRIPEIPPSPVIINSPRYRYVKVPKTPEILYRPLRIPQNKAIPPLG
jgi:hypothetical protein